MLVVPQGTHARALLVQVSSAFEATALAWTRELCNMLAPCGPGYFHYVSHRGQPVLLGLRLGQLSTEHFAMLFLQRHAPGKHRGGSDGRAACIARVEGAVTGCPAACTPSGAAFQCWTTSGVKMGVWTFWSRLLEHGCAFTPAASAARSSSSSAGSSEAPCGVWPLLFLRGGNVTLLAIGRDREQVVQLRWVQMPPRNMQPGGADGLQGASPLPCCCCRLQAGSKRLPARVRAAAAAVGQLARGCAAHLGKRAAARVQAPDAAVQPAQPLRPSGAQGPGRAHPARRSRGDARLCRLLQRRVGAGRRAGLRQLRGQLQHALHVPSGACLQLPHATARKEWRCARACTCRSSSQAAATTTWMMMWTTRC